ncbi:hypothetical protein PDIG_77140 [Penicillium digitatum PHI26]|uniref:Uncharacterized protein n=2 Tax=Penicillium digitatum TaxID=36651 RepID=K9FEC2_PEND2|nr:hypothetical protein PDIP_04260 [Penicillium digitatum Pd1]EKV06517.1 hypothetical protein PDIG_77140 [Penicillium digitatum PHI26]EKV21684.1 hypothetical protein PDIP_04260 [Penicillium digitatum Pd1]
MFHGWKGPFDPNYPLCGASTKVWRGSSGKKKRGDCSWTPTHSGLDGKWPSIAVEVAWTEPPGKLYKDMKFWLTQSSGNVNIVLAVRIYKRGRISIEHWKMGARTPITVQKIEITRNPAPNCEKIQGSMQLSFEDIHMRPKGPTDTDFVISHGDMQNLASQVWEAQDRNL